MLLPHDSPADDRPAGRITRGKTAPNRLRRVDAFLAAYDPALLARRDDALVVDLGYGADPATTLEMARRLRRRHARLPVLGVEIDPARVARARPHADARTFFREGGFDLPLRPGERVRLVRAFNVLRQYDEREAAPALARLCAQVQPGGLVVDGTSDPWGRVWTASLLRCAPSGARLEALAFGTSFRGGLDPEAFQTRLPKSFIHRCRPGDPVHALVQAWRRAARDTRGSAVWGPRAWFAAAARTLAADGHALVRPDAWPRRGWLVWRAPALDADPQPPARSSSQRVAKATASA